MTFAVLLLGACSGPGMKSEPAPTGRTEFPEFSIGSPPGTGWQYARDANGAIFRKEAGPATHTLVALVARHTDFDPSVLGFDEYATKPDVFAAYVKANAEQIARTGKRDIATLERNVKPDSRFGYCVSGHEKSEDYGSDFAPKALVLETWSYTCLAPGNPRVIVEVAFSERALPGEADPGLAAAREAFFNDFRFNGAGASTGVAAQPAAAAPTAAERSPHAEPAAGTDTSRVVSAPADSAVFVVKPTLRDAVSEAIAASAPTLEYRVEPAATSGAALTVELDFKSVVDRSSQLRNQGGAMATGPLGLLVGAITPWACPVEHTLAARVIDPQGKQLGFYQLHESEKRVGTMLICSDVEEPAKSIAVKLVSQLLRAMAADGILR